MWGWGGGGEGPWHETQPWGRAHVFRPKIRQFSVLLHKMQGYYMAGVKAIQIKNGLFSHLVSNTLKNEAFCCNKLRRLQHLI